MTKSKSHPLRFQYAKPIPSLKERREIKRKRLQAAWVAEMLRMDPAPLSGYLVPDDVRQAVLMKLGQV